LPDETIECKPFSVDLSIFKKDNGGMILSIKDKLPLLNSSNKILRLIGYGIYGVVGIFIFLIILGLLIGPGENNKAVDKPVSIEGKANTSVTVPTVAADTVTEDTVNDVLRSHNGGHDYKASVNYIGPEDGYNVVITLLPKDEWSSEWVVKNSANTFVEILKELYKNPNVGRVYIAQQGKFTDQYGNEDIEKAVVVDMRRDTASKINWDKFGDLVLVDYNKLFNVADSYSIHPAIKKDLP